MFYCVIDVLYIYILYMVCFRVNVVTLKHMTYARSSLFLSRCKVLANIGFNNLKSSKKTIENYIQFAPMKPKSLRAFLFQGRFFKSRPNLFFEMLFPVFQGDISSEVGLPMGATCEIIGVFQKESNCFETKKKTLTNSTPNHKTMQTNIPLHKTRQLKAMGTTRKSIRGRRLTVRSNLSIESAVIYSLARGRLIVWLTCCAKNIPLSCQRL